MTQLITPFAKLTLRRLPYRKNETLRAWDAADELLLSHIAENTDLLGMDSNNTMPRILIVNDNFGALACSLSRFSPSSWSDSFLAHQATQCNTEYNHLATVPSCIASIDTPAQQYDFVLLKIPKTLALLEHQLILLRQRVHANTQIIAAGMVKHFNKSHQALFERYIGATTTSRAVKKSRLLFAQAQANYEGISSPYPTQFYHEQLQLTLTNHANVFSRERLDIGARFMIEQFQHLPSADRSTQRIVDLGCGNGVLGIMAKKQIEQHNKQHGCEVHFVDESYMALQSARANVVKAFANDTRCQFHISDCLEQVQVDAVDLILCNPPFHQQHAIGSHIANRMFQHSQSALRRGGQLWVVANRHLGYHIALKRLFADVELAAGNAKFVVLVATYR